MLCSVKDVDRALAEVRRVLRPGGRFRFVEHVVTPRWSARRWVQVLVHRPWAWLLEGCDTTRGTVTALHRTGFADVQLTRRRWRQSFFYPVNSAIYGIATR